MTKKLFNFMFSKKRELFRVLKIKEKSSWYIKNGYKISLPKGLTLTQLSERNLSEIKKIINKNYDQKNYQKKVLFIKKQVNKIEKEITKLDITGLQNKFYIVLTKFGTNGSYEIPNKIIINFNKKSSLKITQIILHEFIHLFLENKAEGNLTHWEKEYLVDLIYCNYFPATAFQQKIPKNIKISKTKIKKISKKLNLVLTST